ncbi:MAG: sigma-54 dependent transcriptional regulator, partial [Acidobacteriota bacterium]
VEQLQPKAVSLGESEAMREIDRMVGVVSESRDTTVLLLGESGTGKGVVAEAIHQRSERREQPFQEINCAGLSETFLESELFGAERGAYTGSANLKRGLLEIADGGTVFLDEVGDLAGALQPKLLKVLESRRFRRLGGVRDIDVDVRIVAATNRDLETAMKEGKYREDLYYRLNVLQLRLPPLRERGRDVLLLAARFLEHFRQTLGRGPQGFTPEAEAILLADPWPGNVRELKNVVERCALLGSGEWIGPEDLPPELTGRGAEVEAPPAAVTTDGTLAEVEKAHIAEVLRRKDGNRTQTALALGISRSTLIEKIKRYDLK